MKVTVSPGSGFPGKVTVAVIVEFMVEFAAIVDGSADMEKSPGMMSTDVDFNIFDQLAIT